MNHGEIPTGICKAFAGVTPNGWKLMQEGAKHVPCHFLPYALSAVE